MTNATKLMRSTCKEAVIRINEQTIELAARAGRNLTDAADAGRKAPDSPEIDLPPGKYKVTLKVASSVAQNREFEVGADETWGRRAAAHRYEGEHAPTSHEQIL